MAGSSTIGLGAGVIIILVLWTTTAFIWVALARSKSSLRALMTTFSSVVSFVLFIIPTAKEGEFEDLEEDDETFYDYMFIWKAILIAILACSVLIGIVLYFTEFWTVKVHGRTQKIIGRVKDQKEVDFF